MSEHNDGGPAFPQVNYARPADGYGASIMEIRGGMSLRDWFAGQALAGMCADPQLKDFAEEFAKMSYKLADKMLANRNLEESK